MRTVLCPLPLIAALVGLAGPAPGASSQAPKRFEPTRASLAARPTPEWFSDARFGIFIHWGVYSVPAWAPKGKYAEWYWNSLVVGKTRPDDIRAETTRFHDRVYGPDFSYHDFAPMFKAEMFNPDQWADLFARSGARYIVLTSKHHDGYCLWPSREANKSWARPWNSVDVGPRRDLIGELTTAVRARGLKMGLYYSLYEWYNPLYLADFPRFRDEHFHPQFKDLVTRYAPSIVWADGQWDHSFDDWRSADLLAWLFNEAPNRDELAVNDRWGGRRQDPKSYVTGYRTSEYERGFDPKAGPWEECRGMGASFGYNRNEGSEDYRTTGQLIRLLAEMAAKGGNLLLDIGPTADGRIPAVMQERLIEMGRWLKVNGEAIYGTTAGPVQPSEHDLLEGVGAAGSAVSAVKEAELAKARKWVSTARPGKVFIHVFDAPAGGKLALPALKQKVRKAYLLDGSAPLRLAQSPTGTTVELPGCLPDPWVTVVVLETQ